MNLTMFNDPLLTIFLFMFYLSIASIFLYQAPSISQEETPSVPTLQDYALAFEDDEEIELIDLESLFPSTETEEDNEENNEDSSIMLADNSESDETLTPKPKNELSTLIQSLKQTKLRKLCRPLGIQQKRNGVWLSTELMRAEIQRQVKQNPELVIQTIQQRLPEINIVAIVEGRMSSESQYRSVGI